MIKTQNHEMSLAWEQSGHDRGVSRAARSNTLSYGEPYARTAPRTSVLIHLGTLLLPYGLTSAVVRSYNIIQNEWTSERQTGQ